MNDYEQFRRETLNLNDPRQHKVKNSCGVYDAYKYIRKNKWFDIGRPLKEGEFYRIIRKVNYYIAREIMFGEDVILPHKMGKIELRKYPNKISIVNGKLVTNLPVDWDATLKLWYEDELARAAKQVVYIPEKERFLVYYNRAPANYVNQVFYLFTPNRDIKTKLKQNIKAGRVDAFTVKNKDDD